MAKSKKTKIHKKIDGQLLQMNKKFSDLKMKQRIRLQAGCMKNTKSM